MSRAKTHNKYVVQRSVGGRSVEKEDDGSPVLGKCVKTNVRITPEMAGDLNHGWDSSEHALTFYFKEVEEVKETKSQGRIDLEKEAESLGVQFRSNIGDDKLQEKINEAKNE